MKNYRIVAVLAVLILSCAVLFACSEGEINIDLKDLTDAIGEKIDLSDHDEYSDERINDNFGITKDDAKQIFMLKKIDESNVGNAELMIFVEASDKDKAKEIEDKLKIYKNNKLKELENYAINPDNERQYYLVQDSEIIVEKQYVFWAVDGNSKEINDIIKECIKNSKTKS